MTAETLAAKAARLVNDHKVRQVLSKPGEWWGVVSSSEDWIVVLLPGRGWSCTCPASTRCSHICAALYVYEKGQP